MPIREPAGAFKSNNVYVLNGRLLARRGLAPCHESTELLGPPRPLVLGAALAPASQAQDIRLYAFSSGALTGATKGFAQNLAPLDQPIQLPVGFFVVRHPKGNVLFDTGNNDRIITDPSYWGDWFKALKPVNTPDVAIDVQLQKIGLKPDDITYVVASHLHLDRSRHDVHVDVSVVPVRLALEFRR